MKKKIDHQHQPKLNRKKILDLIVLIEIKKN